MKNLRLFLPVALLFVAASAQADDGCDTDCSSSCDNAVRTCQPVYLPRSAGDNLVRNNHWRAYEYGNDCWNVQFDMTYQYQRSFNEECIVKSLFGPAAQNGNGVVSGNSCDSDCDDNCGDTLRFVGSQVANRNNEADILAENFGFSPQTNASLKLDPEIQNHIFDFQLYFGLDEICDGLYFQLNAPLVHTKWSLLDDDCCNQQSTDLADNAFRAGCIDAVNQDAVSPNTDLQSALRGNISGVGDISQDLRHARFSFCEEDETKLADVRMALGYNVWECPDYHLGLYLLAVAPTGTDLDEDNCSRLLFNPIVGNGGHWELGGGIHAHADLYCWDEDHYLSAFMQGHVTHQFDDCQIRTFDLKDGDQGNCLSRYALLKEFDSENAYTGNLISAANLTTRKVDVEVDVKGEALLELYYRNCGFYGAVGYNVWGKDNEDVCDKGAFGSDIANARVGIKGCAPVEATCFAVNEGAIAQNPNPQGSGVLHSTQSNATAFSCGSVDSARDIPGDGFCADSCKDLSSVTAGTPVADLASVKAQDSLKENGDANPSLLTKDNLNIVGNDSQVSHKIYGRYGYEFCDSDFSPYIEVGASVEFASSERPNTLEQWGIFARGGISF